MQPKLDASFDTIINGCERWTIPEVPSRCPAAQTFLEWIQENLSDEVLGVNIKRLTLIMAKAKLTDQYRFFRRQVDKRCRNNVSERGHECIFHIWDQSYQRLEAIEGRLPEPLSVPELEELKELKKKDREERPFATLVALQEDE